VTLRRLLLAAGSSCVLAGPSLADPAITSAPSNMRRAANPYSRIVQTVPANAQVDIQNCGGEWCYGSWRGLHGFLPSFAVGQGGPPVGAVPPVAFAPPPFAVTGPVVVAPAPVWGGPYVGVGVGWNRW
jgi:hypothetical protein